MTAVDLLTAFSGDGASRFQPFFEFTEASRILGVEIHAVGTDSTTLRYSGQEESFFEVNNILRLTTADGYEGVSGVDTFHEAGFSDELLVDLQGVTSDFVSLDSLDPVVVGAEIERLLPGSSDAARSSIDIALWDLAARKARCPLYEMLGAKRSSIGVYASLPFYDSVSEHVDAVYESGESGFSAFKFHGWGSIEEDIRLVETVQQTFADSGYRFMIDLEGKYDLNDALRLGKRLNEELFIWLEAPIADEHLAQYGKLRAQITTPVIPDGCRFYSPGFIKDGIAASAWDAGRFDTTGVGGISKALELLIIANEAGLPMELQSWGHSLAQAANLHVALANGRTRYFEAPTPTAAFEFGMKNGIPMEGPDAAAPEGPGLGIEVDWQRLGSADFYEYSRYEI